MEFTEVIKARYACRKFGPQEVEPEKLEAILQAGRLAPTAKNLQEQRIYVVKSPEYLNKIDALTPCRYGASVCLVVAYDSRNVYTYPGRSRDSGVEDASIAATHMMLAAADLGVQSCWVNFFNPDDMAAALGLPEHEKVVMLMPLGYAELPKGAPAKLHTERRPLSETISYL